MAHYNCSYRVTAVKKMYRCTKTFPKKNKNVENVKNVDKNKKKTFVNVE